MPSSLRFCVVALTLGLTCLTAHAFAKKPIELWSFFYFNGTAFVAGRPEPLSPFVAVRDGFVPVVETREERIKEVKLHEGTGALVGICYVQSYGGKLKPARGFHPVPMQEIAITAADGQSAIPVQTDGNGYFVSELPAGSYRVGNQQVEVRVDNGKTNFIPVRVGKRMVD
ncbi:carboxypeptidase-like regulatory domain-containing protein [Geomonas oryzisoli]|uniref:Carboxypeptidase-like regulatory domain-containing protein n=1 Tax=Geomonas oryzisoli TaxID=2847992 RepID=A0ABX8JHH2_9BACT|nr:carboxypeptidase-like regulatory domain-containing protein [Geomonas oryzisoli]QWV94935.1 carboxypeptidase-like regulatory domain-containing protein [Geomonas oryzisoli]